jgi:hypothetical protein
MLKFKKFCKKANFNVDFSANFAIFVVGKSGGKWRILIFPFYHLLKLEIKI